METEYITPLTISKEEFLEIYAGTSEEANVDLFYIKPEDIEGKHNAAKREAIGKRKFLNKLWRLNTFYFIKNKQGKKVKFKMNHGQHRVHAASLKHPRLVILKSRQIGISTLKLITYFDDIVTIPNIEVGLVSHGLYAAEKNLEKIKLLWENLHPLLKGSLKVVSNSTKSFALSNGTQMYVKGAFRGTTLHRLHVSEFGKTASEKKDVAAEILSGTLQAVALGNPVVFESTAEGPNEFMKMWNKAITAESTGHLTEEDFKPVFLSWLDDPECQSKPDAPDVPDTTESREYFEELTKRGFKFTQRQRNFWIKKAELLGERIYKEFPADPGDAFKASQKGAYYAKIYDDIIMKEKRIKKKLYDPNIRLYLSMDIGFDDYFVLCYFQIGPKREMRIVDEYKMQHMDLKHYAEHIHKNVFPDAFGEPKTPDYIFFPHDVRVREQSTGKSREEIFREYGIEGEVIEAENVNEGIEQCREMLRHAWLEEHCTYLRDCICNYKKEYSPRLDQFLERPKRDEFAHGADALRYAAIVWHRETGSGSEMDNSGSAAV